MMNRVEEKLYNAILVIYEESQTEYNGIEDEQFMDKICREIGLTEAEYTELMLDKDFSLGYDFEEICPLCDYVNEYKLSDTKDYKNGKKIVVCQNCGSVIFACNLCDCDGCGECYIDEGYKF